MKTLAIACTLFFLALSFAAAQSVSVNGQIRERSEFNTKSMKIGQSSDVYHYLRSRLKMTGTLNEQVSAVFEVQDARMYGAESSTMNSGASAFDLRQGYVEVKDAYWKGISFKLGRQTLSYADERFFGAIEWNNFGQSFDAGIIKIDAGEVTVDVFGAAISRMPNPVGSYTRDVFLTGTWIAWKPKEVKSTLQGFIVYDNPKNVNDAQQRFTSGLYLNGMYSDFDFELDGAYQFGEYSKGVSLGGSLIGIRAGYTLKEIANLRIGVGFDMLSGMAPKDTASYSAFQNLYGTNHKYYGFMDYFTSFPSHTNNLGLQDLLVQVSATPISGLKVSADVHLFSTATDPQELLPAANNAVLSKSIGNEIDLTASWNVAEFVGMTAGLSVFDGHADRVLNTGRKTTNWVYLMTMVNL